MTKAQQQEKQEAIQRLNDWIKPGDTVYTVLRHVSKSGMKRRIGVVKFINGEPIHPNHAVSRALGYTLGNDDSIVVHGCGMDMGFEVVYNLGRTLYPNGFECIGKDCRSNDHSNGDRNYKPHHHNDGGYALNHKWL